MSNPSHEPSPRPPAAQAGQRRVPRSLFAIIILCLAGLYWFAAYGDTPAPEKTVKTFYKAYFGRDYQTVADNLSVFWSVRFLPEYADLEPAELLASRPQIVNSIAGVIEEIENENTIPEDVEIDINRQYTRIGKTSAIVAYEFKEQGQPTSMEAAILILEKGEFRIFNMSTIDETVLPEIEAMDMRILDENLDELLSSPGQEAE